MSKNEVLTYDDVINTLGGIRECLILKDSRRCSRNCDSCKLNIKDASKITVVSYVMAVMNEIKPLLVEEEKPKRKRTPKKEESNETNKKTNKTTKRVPRKEQ